MRSKKVKRSLFFSKDATYRVVRSNIVRVASFLLLLGRELFLKIYQLVKLSFLFQKGKDTIPGFHFCPGTIFKNGLGSRDTTWHHGQKSFFWKNLKNYRSIERCQKTALFQKTVLHENELVLSYFKLKFLWIQGVIKRRKSVSFCFFS